MSPENMADHTRELELSLKDIKIEDNEKETVAVQRRAIRANKDILPKKLMKKITFKTLSVGAFNRVKLNML